jgi:hypothetical protein
MHMKPNRDAAALAASLTNAANTPLPLPVKPPVTIAAEPPEPERADPTAPAPRKPRKARPVLETVGITLRPSAELLNRYTMAAAERTKKEGKVISAQQIMLEVLEREMKVKA